MATIPFTDAGLSEVLARVCYAYVKREWNAWGKQSALGSEEFLDIVTHDLPGPYFGFLKTHLLAARIDIAQGSTFIRWRDAVVLRSRAGHGWRRCLYPAYKAGRRKDYPRVTNRGVVPPSRQQSFGDDILRDAPNGNE